VPLRDRNNYVDLSGLARTRFVNVGRVEVYGWPVKR